MNTIFNLELARSNRINKKHNITQTLYYDSYLLLSIKFKIMHNFYNILLIKAIKTTNIYLLYLMIKYEYIYFDNRVIFIPFHYPFK